MATTLMAPLRCQLHSWTSCHFPLRISPTHLELLRRVYTCHPPRILTHAITDAYYQELLGTTISMLLSRHTPLQAFSDCSSAIRRTQQALYPLGPAVGHLQHGDLLLGVRAIATQTCYPTTLKWTPSQPERSKHSPNGQRTIGAYIKWT
jgi:hypothetical protein